MNALKKVLSVAMISGMLFASCDTKPADTTTETIKLADGTEIVVYMNNDEVVSFKDWGDFERINKEMEKLKKADYNFDINDIDNLEGMITNLETSIPKWLRTEEVMEDIEDVKEEYAKLAREKNEPMKNVLQNIEELNEKLDDLVEEVNETIEKYRGK
jgi:DNA repair exonuclease SbcCD ATPase subunit